MMTLHLMTQRGQPYGSERKCCEMCGLMMVARPDSFWREHVWTDDPLLYHSHGDTYETCITAHNGAPEGMA